MVDITKNLKHQHILYYAIKCCFKQIKCDLQVLQLHLTSYIGWCDFWWSSISKASFIGPYYFGVLFGILLSL
jgi:hypothetical protein